MLKKQKLVAVFLVFSLIIGILPVSVLAADTTGSFEATGGMVYYEIDDAAQTVTITGCDTTVTAIEIPNSLEKLPVTKIADGAFNNNGFNNPHNSLTSVKLPSTLTNIGKSAFYNCTNLSNVDLTACTELTTIGDEAFSGNSALTSVKFPASLRYIGSYAFNNCGLTNVDLSGCTQLLSLGESAFNCNKELVAVKLPPNVETISESAFWGCEKLADVNFIACTSLKTIGQGAFCWTGLTSVTLPSSLSSLGVGVFQQCFQLKNADLSACTGLTVIEDSMFSECKALSSVKLPDSVALINKEAFAFCTSLSGIDLTSCLNLTRIEERAFYGDSSLSDLKLSKALVSIGKEAFSACTALSSLDLSVCTSLSEIGELAFNQISVTSLSFPASLETIGRCAFNDCSKLTSVSWPNDSKLTTLTGFSGCTALPVSVYNEGVSLPNVSAIGDAAFMNCSFESVTIPSNIREIGDRAFSTDNYEYENKLKELTIMTGVETIGESAFAGCPITGTLNIPETVREIKYEAFVGTKITGLNIANGVETIGERAFDECVELEGSTIVVPESVALVGRDAFYGVTKPLTVVFRNRNIQLQEAPYGGQLTVGDKEYYSPFESSYESTNIIIKAYEKNSNGEASMMKLLYDALVNDPDKDPDDIYKFIAISDRTVKVSGSIQSKAKVEICIDGQSVPVQISSGKFSVIADEGSTVTVKATANGYYDKNFIKADINEDWELGEIAFGESDKVPANNLMRIDFGDIAVSRGDKLTFTLKGGGEALKQGKDYTVQYPYIVLNNSVTAQRLTLSVNADELLYSAKTVTALRESGVFKVTLTPWGKINVATTGDFAGDNNILVFDANENAVAQGVVNKNGILITDSLKAGTYKVVAFNANDSFSAISTVSTLEAMGLKKGTDYAEETVKVTDGKTAELTLNVPLLKTVTSNILNKNNCRLVAEQSRTVAGRTCRTRVFYSFAGGKNGTVTVALPKGASVQTLYTQKEVLQKGVDYAAKGNTVTVNVKDSEGMFYITNVFSGVGEQSITAFGTVGNASAPIGSATVAVEGMYLVPESQILTVSSNNKATVTSAPNSEVELWLDNDVVAWGTTNGNGNAVLTYNLPEVVLAGQEFKLKAVCGEFSAETAVSFSSKPKNTGLETWYFYNGSSYKQFLYSSSSTDDVYPSYTVNNHNSNVNFVATIISEAAPTNVITYAVMTDGNVEYVPMTLISSEAISSGAYQSHYKRYTFAGSLNKVLMATDFAIDWDEDTEYFTYNAKTVEAVNSKCNEVMTTRREQIETARESYVDKLEGIVPNVDDASKYIFGGKYHMSETEWFKGLSDTEQTAAYGLEKAIDKNISQLSKILDLKRI
ncbi:MAG: leucine-rich repeat domain-containing protein [Acutalibacteraceae bacterium]